VLLFAAVDSLNTVWIGEDKLNVFKANFVLHLVLRVLGFIPGNPAFFHDYSVLQYALLVKGYVQDFPGHERESRLSGPSSCGETGAVAPQGRPHLSIVPAREGGT
jgi:hypothetical protein